MNEQNDTSAQNTQGRIRYRENGDANSYALLDERGRWLLSLLHNGEELTYTQRENMRRLVACWNACEGTSTESLEALAAIGGVKALEEYSRELKARRDSTPPATEPEEELTGYATPEETAAVLRNATPDDLWLAAQIERIDPHEAEQGNDGAHTRAVVKLALEMRDQRDEARAQVEWLQSLIKGGAA